MKRIAALPLLVPLSALSAQTASTPPSATGSVLQMLMGLGIVLVALFGALKLLRKLQVSHSGAANALKVLSAAAVGPRERVVLVSVGKTVLVLGVAPGRVSALHSMDITELPAAPIASAAEPADFASRLKRFMDKRTTEGGRRAN